VPRENVGAFGCLKVAGAGADKAGMTLDAEASHLMNHARTDFSSGRFAEAIAGCKEALVCAGDPRTRVMALQTFIESLLHMGRISEANTALGELRTEAATDPAFAYATAEPEARLRLADRTSPWRWPWFRAVPEDVRHDEHSSPTRTASARSRSKALYFLERPHEAAQMLRDCLADGHLPLTVPEIADALEPTARPWPRSSTCSRRTRCARCSWGSARYPGRTPPSCSRRSGPTTGPTRAC